MNQYTVEQVNEVNEQLPNMQLPWPRVMTPQYRPGTYGRWKLSTTVGTMPGYFTPIIEEMEAPALRRNEHGKDIVWMSLANMELESHMPHIEAAHGHTVVMGLGMGMYLYNIIQKPEVSRVTVIERDASVAKLLSQITNYDEWVGINKVQIIIADARTWKTSEHIDFLYADFWKRLADSNALRYTRQALANTKPKTFGYWTQEFDFIDYCRSKQINITTADRDLFNSFVSESFGGEQMMVGQNSDTYPILSGMAVVLQAIVASREDPVMVDRLFEVYQTMSVRYERLMTS